MSLNTHPPYGQITSNKTSSFLCCAAIAHHYENGDTRVPLWPLRKSEAPSFRERQSYKRWIEALAAKLKLHRLNKHLSVEELADKTGIPAERIKMLEDGAESPYFDEMLMLAKAYNIPLSDIARLMQEYYEDFVAHEERASK